MREIAHKKDIPTELTVEIEKLSNLGFGIARIDGYVIFVEMFNLYSSICFKIFWRMEILELLISEI